MRTITALFTLTMLTGCGGSSTDAQDDEGTSGHESAATPGDLCLATMQRERECADTFLPALVALRVRLDQPSGIAAQDASAGRDSLVAQARQEYESDATDERFAANCAQMEQLPAEQAESWTGMMRECLAASGCEAFVECDMRFTEARFSR